MNKLIVTNREEVSIQKKFTTELFSRWISFVDAKPKTIETYTRNIRPFIQPELVVDEFKSDKIAFRFIVINAPVVELGEYKGLTVEKPSLEVTEADLTNELNALANKNAELVVADINEEAKLVLHDTIATMNFRENHDWNEIRNQIRKPLRNFFYKKTMRTPMILPIVFRV